MHTRNVTQWPIQSVTEIFYASQQFVHALIQTQVLVILYIQLSKSVTGTVIHYIQKILFHLPICPMKHTEKNSELLLKNVQNISLYTG